MNVHDVGGRRRFEDSEFTLRIYPGTIAEGTIYCPISAHKSTTAAEVIDHLINKLQLDKTKCYVLAEVKEFGGEEWILNPTDCPVQRMMLWPRMAMENCFSGEDYRFLLREKNLDGSIHYGNLQMWLRVTEERRRMVERGFLPQPQQKDYDDLCNLPDLNEKTLLDNLRSRFKQEKIYTYVGSILIVINPFKFLPIYNPKYVKMYDNHQLGKLEPHIYAVADVAYHAMLQQRNNQCIVISGESGSGKTQSTNFLIHHLTALSQKGFASGVEQIILGAGPVLEAFGNAKTAHNNNSSRFGKFIQVNYHETGTVRGAYVEKYLLEKSRLVYQEHNERNYHVFYYLLAGASEEERTVFHLKQPDEYHYLNQMTKKPLRLHWKNYYETELQDCFTVEGEDLKHDFERLQLAMEMVGFLPATRKQIFSLLSAILHLGNICYKKKTYRDDSIDICNPEALPVVSKLLEVKEEMLFDALTTRKTVTVGEKLIVPYRLSEAVTVRDSMAKSLYSALFDWIVFRINHALLNTRDLEESTKILSIGVLDIFGFEDYENNSFEQFCINFANERLQHYFNQHIFSLEQEEYRSEGISWHNIAYIDNTGCINLISKKPTALFHLLDEECNFPQASNQTLLDKFKRQHEGNSYIEFPAVMEPAFIIRHYAGKVKYGVKDFREKNTDHMRPDIIALLKSSKNSFICGLIGIDPVATFRWAVLRSYFRAVVGFREAGKRYVQKKMGHDDAVPCAVLKSVDSFSFLHHPVHQRSLEILQRCKEEKYSITRKSPRTPLSDLQGANTINEKTQRDSLSLGWNGRSVRQGRLSSSGSLLEEDGIFINSTSNKLLERAHGILMRNKHFKLKPSLPKHLLDVKSLKYLSNLTLQDRITKSLLHLHKKKKTPSISAQFQASLNKLMETLGQAEPYFVKCIRSNAEKLPLRFSDTLVLRQLRYTGMLETVRIRQSGYSIKYTFQDFVDHFHVLLPDGTGASQHSIREYLSQVDVNPDSFQVGNTMVFMREVERQRLQDLLHQEVLRRIIILQRWFRTLLERNHFLSMKQAATAIQRWWRSYRMKQARAESEADPALLHGAATSIQSSWRGYRERRRFLQMREAAFIIQRSWRRHCYQRGEAAVCIQAAWRGYRERRVYRTQMRRIILLQAACRGYLAQQRFRDMKEQKVTERQLENGQSSPTEEEEEKFGNKDIPEIMEVDPTNWEDRSYQDRETFLRRLSSTQDCNQEEMSRDSRSDSLDRTIDDCKGGEGYTGVVQEVVVRERPKSLDDPKQKKVVRAKRESRRMRELEQAKFSLELLKVRSTGGVSPSEERRWSTELISPQGTPDSESSRGSFELLTIDDYPKVKPASAESEESGSPSSLLEHQDILSSSPALPDSLPTESEILNSEPLSTSPIGLTPITKIENSLPIFYVPHSKSSTVACRTSEDSTAASKPAKERRESVRKPVVVVISMQKDTLLDDSLVQQPPQMRDSESQTIELPAMPREVCSSSSVPGGVNSAVLEKLEKLNVEKAERQKQQQQQNEKDMMDQIRQQKEILGNQRKVFEQNERDMFEKQRGEALQKIEQSRRSGPTQPITTSSKSVERPQSLLITQGPWEPSAPRGVSPSAVDSQIILTANTGDKDSIRPLAKERPISMFLERREGLRRAPQDFEKVDSWTPKRDGAARNEHIRQPKVPSLSTDGTAADRPTPMFFSPKDNRVPFTKFEKESANQEKSSVRRKERPASAKLVKVPGHKGHEPASQTEDQNMMHKTMSSGDLGKMDSMRKNAHTDGRVRGKMRFWGKTKQGDKKLSREKLASQAEQHELQEGLDTGLHMGDGPERQVTPPCSPDLAAERGKEFKENKEPSPKVRCRKSIKISNVALEQAQWQNDSLQILTSAGDYKCMNEFLQKKITDLDTEDSKKDTLVDVVFKKALKEFRLNIFNSYSTALAMDDGKSIRYKDLYALFEQILEKTMRQEQRDWSESPVKVWVNTFKVFLDEFMTEYKTLDSTVGKAPKPERKKRRKKDSDIVEEHNGHIFKSTQYSIPTYCEYCSSLIWMMDKACVCKLCRFACHRKCCLKTTTRCSKKYDPELSSRQFGVEVSRLTNDERTVPLVVEKLINYIEMHGLYTEGIYRKSGSTNKIKELKLGLDTDVNSMNLDDYNIHVIASVFKQWLRDLPNPVMTFELYEEFLRAMGLQEKKEIIRGVYSVIDQLPRTHLNTLERLIFHLVRIAMQEDTNRMSSNALAIVFAPCILRCPDTIDPLQSVQDIGKTTACVELICVEQMNKYIARLKDINSLEFAENKAKSRLTLVRRSMGKGRLRRSSYHAPSSPVGTRLPSVSDVPDESAGEEAGVEVELSEQQQVAMQQEERVLTEQIESLQKEKEELTFEMLALEPRASDDETLESEASIGTADSSENLNVDSEGAASDMSERSSVWAAALHKQPESSGKTRRQLRKQTDSMDSVDSTSTVPSISSASHLHQGTGQRFRFRPKSRSTAFYRASPPRDTTEPQPEQGADERPQFTSRGTFSPEKGKQKLKTIKNSPQKPREPPDSGGGRKRNPEPDFGSPQQLVVYGSNEFMV
ncbi:unconventional myosin-IXAa-like isoform X6 [Polyodon spathula]|uniref:unconventional myosin-IXAa-like isoform X6 n=1 Tax=Polyodon spathula TaxID=7913 RepID=UPI001B7E5AA9|nr:unconventional myosin-IXAa-like isoform X6 [Polyodon spathula]